MAVGERHAESTLQERDPFSEIPSTVEKSAPIERKPSQRQPRSAALIDTEAQGVRYRQYVVSETQAENVLTLFQNRPRLLTLRVAPIRTYIPEAGGDIIAIRFVDPDAATQIAIEPLAVGSTVLTMWFPNPGRKVGRRLFPGLSTSLRILRSAGVLKNC